MKVDVVMPKMGESLQEGTIIKWLKNVGDKVERDEMILEISTDKVDTEVPSPQSGVLVEVLADEEEVVEVGTKIAVIETDADAAASGGGDSSSDDTAQEEESTEEETQEEEVQESADDSSDDDAGDGELQDLVMPKMGESLQEGTITKWLKSVGDKVERDEMILEISTDKVDTEVPSPVAGVLKEILAEEEETVEVGSVIGKIATSGGGGGSKKSSAKKSEPKKETKTEEKPKEEKKEQKSTSSAPSRVEGTTYDIPRKKDGNFYSPLVRAIAEDNKVSLEELESIDGSGADGRITKEDLENYIDNRGSQPAPQKSEPAQQTQESSQPSSQPAASKAAATPPSTFGGDSEVIKMDRMRQLIADHMVASKQTSAHVTSVAEVDLTGLVQYREKNKAQFLEREGIKLTYTSFFAKALIDGVKEFPMVNVSVDGKNIIKHNRINLGFATALPDGNLIVPVIKNADNYGITGLQRSITDLASRARNKKLNPDDIQGGTITLTNVGTFGTLFGTPVINQPQVAIIGVGAIKKRPVVKEIDGSDAIVIRHMMNISITYDHRVIDGMLAGQTLKKIVDTLESMNEDTIQL